MTDPSDLAPDDHDASTRREPGMEDAATPLRKAREAAGLSREEVATQLNLSVDTIEALETGAYDRLPPPTFVRGYLRGYARLLHLDTDRLLQLYDASRPTELPQITSVSKVVAQPGSGHPIMRWATVLIVVGLVGMAALWWHREYREPAPTAEVVRAPSAPPAAASSSAAGPASTAIPRPGPEPTATLAPTVDGPNADGAAAGPGSAPVAPLSEPAPPAVTSPVVDSAPPAPAVSQAAPVQAPVAPTPAPAPSAPVRAPAEVVAADVLMAQAEGESWMEVHDAEDRQLYFDLLRSGAPARLEGTAPFRIFLGNAPAVSLHINGVAVDLGAFIRSNNTARFVVDKDGARRR